MESLYRDCELGKCTGVQKAVAGKEEEREEAQDLLLQDSMCGLVEEG